MRSNKIYINEINYIFNNTCISKYIVTLKLIWIIEIIKFKQIYVIE